MENDFATLLAEKILTSVREFETSEEIIYQELKEERDGSGIKLLLDETINDCNNYYANKQGIENRFGLLIALWGVLIAIFIQEEIVTKIFKNIKEMIEHMSKNTQSITLLIITLGVLLLAFTILTGVISVIMILKGIKSVPYPTIKAYEMLEQHISVALKNSNLLTLLLLCQYIEVLENTKKKNTEKSILLNKAVVITCVFGILIWLCSFYIAGVENIC